MNFALTLLATIPFYVLACWLFLPDEPRKKLFDLRTGLRFILGRLFEERVLAALLFAVLALHIAEVFFDPELPMLNVMLTSFFQQNEGRFWSAVFGAIDANSPLENAASKYLSVVYIVIHPIMLGFVPLFLLFSGSRLFKGISASYLSMYAISLPFYLFFPVNNVFTAYGRETALGGVFDGITEGWYKVTTENNCFPSLHVAMVVIIAAFAYFYWKDEERTGAGIGNRGMPKSEVGSGMSEVRSRVDLPRWAPTASRDSDGGLRPPTIGWQATPANNTALRSSASMQRSDGARATSTRRKWDVGSKFIHQTSDFILRKDIRHPTSEHLTSHESRIPSRGKIFFAINTVYAASVGFAVIFLTIHWLTDVAGGIVVAAISIYFGTRYSGRNEKRTKHQPEEQP